MFWNPVCSTSLAYHFKSMHFGGKLKRENLHWATDDNAFKAVTHDQH